MNHSVLIVKREKKKGQFKCQREKKAKKKLKPPKSLCKDFVPYDNKVIQMVDLLIDY